jgi:hypothetical protein
MWGGAGEDVLYLVLTDATRAAVEAELVAGAPSQRLDAIGVVTVGIEKVVLLDPGGDWIGGIVTPAPVGDAALWGFV